MSHQTRRTAPPYSEEQVTRWLAWLASRMVEKSQTTFLLEQLQPDWLSTQGQRRTYIVASRLLWGILSGLITTCMPDNFMPFLMMTLGVIGGIVGGAIDSIRLARYRRKRVEYDFWDGRSTVTFVLGVLFFVLLFLVIGDVIKNHIYYLIENHIYYSSTLDAYKLDAHPLIDRLIPDALTYEMHIVQGYPDSMSVAFPFVGGLLLALFWSFRSLRRDFDNEIRTIEALRLIRNNFSKGFKKGLLVGVILGLFSPVIVPVYILFATRNPDWSDLVSSEMIIFYLVGAGLMGSVVGISGGLVGGVSNCLQPRVRELKIAPNQGIWLTMRSASIIGGIGWLVFGIAARPLSLDETSLGIGHGMIGGLCFGLMFGGLDVIQHYIVRFLLWRSGSLPWRLAPLLDYAAEELHFLQKVGGGYIFVHRYLLEYFAALGGSGSSDH